MLWWRAAISAQCASPPRAHSPTSIFSQPMFLTNFWRALFEKATRKEVPPRSKWSTMPKKMKEKSAETDCIRHTRLLSLPWHYFIKFRELRILRTSSKDREFFPEQIWSGVTRMGLNPSKTESGLKHEDQFLDHFFGSGTKHLFGSFFVLASTQQISAKPRGTCKISRWSARRLPDVINAPCMVTDLWSPRNLAHPLRDEPGPV